MAGTRLQNRILSLLLAGTAWAAFTPAAAQSPPLKSVVDSAAAQAKYTPEQAALRAENLRAGKFQYAGRAEGDTLKSFFGRCMQADYAAVQVPDSVKGLWDNLRAMENSGGLMAPHLASFAARSDIFFCYGSPQDTANAGVWTRAFGVVRIAPKYSLDNQLLTQAHEIIHDIQTMTRAINDDSVPSLREFQLAHLSYEAAAAAGTYVLALDMEANGDRRYLKALEEENAAYVGEVEDAYKKALRKGASKKAALTAAGGMAFDRVIRNQFWLNAYNVQVLDQYLPSLIAGELARKTTSYTVEKARKTGWVSDDFNFTAPLKHLPNDAERFGNRRFLREAFDYVELERIAQLEGRDSRAYRKMNQKLVKNENLYLGVNLAEVVKELQKPDNKKSAYKIMDDLRPKRHQPAPTALQHHP